jgi:hypothetical protein
VVWVSVRVSSTRDLERENDSLPCLPGNEEVEEPDVERRFEEVEESDMFLFLGPAMFEAAEREE